MFVCIENNQVISVVDYQPNVPSTVRVVEISAEDYLKIQNKTHTFDVPSLSVKAVSQNELNKEVLRKKSAEFREYLNSTDWLVLRHIREKTLKMTTTLTEDQYKQLEQQRHDAAQKIVKA